MSLITTLRRFTIRQRMNGAIAVLVAALGLIGASALVGGSYLSKLNSSFIEHSFKEAHDLTEVRQLLGKVRQHEKDMLIDYEDGVAVLKHREAWANDVRRVRAALGRLLEGEEDADNAFTREALKQLDGYVVQVDPVLLNIQDGAFNSPRDADTALGRAKQHAQALEKNIDHIAEVLDIEARNTRSSFDAALLMALWAYAGMVGLITVLVVPMTLANARSIIDPIESAREFAESIAEGRLTLQSADTGQDEASELMQALVHMQQVLTGMVQETGRTAQHIQMTGQEVASSSHNLAERTEQAASNLQQTAASVEQLTSAMCRSADSAASANELAGTAAELATRGGEAVARVVETMAEIDAASQQIASIIGVIDDIAFQTNILALNAAVEAARAGDQGRGFAVVASEVRSLAQRAADAAGEIKSLIITSVERVEHGSHQARRAGATIGELVGSVQKVSQIIGEITAATSEQSAGITQVNSAVAELERMTQNNAVMVEEFAVTANDLRDQAITLGMRVGKFRLTDEPAQTAPPGTAAPAFGGDHTTTPTGLTAGADHA